MQCSLYFQSDVFLLDHVIHIQNSFGIPILSERLQLEAYVLKVMLIDEEQFNE